jgi:hypothetical protein
MTIEELRRIATSLQGFVGRSHMEGLAGISPSQDGRRIDLYWHGRVPDALLQYLQSTDGGRGRVVTVRSAPFSRATLEDAEQRLLDLQPHAGIQAVGPAVDGSHLMVLLAPTASSPQQPADDVERLSRAAGVPVDVSYGEIIVPLLKDPTPLRPRKG